MEEQEIKPFDIGERTFQIALNIVRLCKECERRNSSARTLARQLLRSGRETMDDLKLNPFRRIFLLACATAYCWLLSTNTLAGELGKATLSDKPTEVLGSRLSVRMPQGSKKDVREWVAKWSGKYRIETLQLPTIGLKAVAVNPLNAPDHTRRDDATFVEGLFVVSADRTIQSLDVYVNATAEKDLEGCKAVAQKKRGHPYSEGRAVCPVPR